MSLNFKRQNYFPSSLLVYDFACVILFMSIMVNYLFLEYSKKHLTVFILRF